MKFLIHTTFPDEMRLRNALTKIKGLGKTMSLQICDETGVSERVLLKSCLSKDIDNISAFASNNYIIHNELIVQNQKALSRLRHISTYRAVRFSRNLPCRGQRTRSNAMTCRHLKRGVAPVIQKRGFY